MSVAPDPAPPVVVAVSGLPGHGKSTFTEVASRQLGLAAIAFDQVVLIVNEATKELVGDGGMRADGLLRHAASIARDGAEVEAVRAIVLDALRRHSGQVELYHRAHVRGGAVAPEVAATPGASRPYNLGACGLHLGWLADDLADLVLSLDRGPVRIVDGYQLDPGGPHHAALAARATVIDVIAERDHRRARFAYRVGRSPLRDLPQALGTLATALTSMPSYQSFSPDGGTSPSDRKLPLLGIPERLDGRTVLDLGCNEGFFAFECERRGARAMGIERDPDWYAAALARKEQLGSFVNFRNLSWDDVPGLGQRFDLVLWLAAFHYVERDHVRVLRGVASRMTPSAILILEVGLAEGDDDRVETRSRPAGDVCYYPTWSALVRFLTETGFSEVRRQGPGMSIVGDDVARHVVHATRSDTAEPAAGEPVDVSWDASADVYDGEPSLVELERVLLRLYHGHPMARRAMRAGHRAYRAIRRRRPAR